MVRELNRWKLPQLYSLITTEPSAFTVATYATCPTEPAPLRPASHWATSPACGVAWTATLLVSVRTVVPVVATQTPFSGSAAQVAACAGLEPSSGAAIAATAAAGRSRALTKREEDIN